MLITFEGIDGCGKTTQIKMLQQRLVKEKLPVEVLREPGGTDLSEMIRSILLNPDVHMSPVTELMLFSAARSELVSARVLPLLKERVVVILDRFYDSTVAYQGFGRGSLPISEINKLNEIAGHQLEPDITFFIDVDVDLALNRRASSGRGPDRIEIAGQAFYERVRDGFTYLASQKERFVRIDGAQSIDKIHQQVWMKVSSMIWQ
ncbi:MAG: dTMP kinase [Balneolales bacterium]|nr:dTMP kinase [Balneolales bacterium]